MSIIIWIVFGALVGWIASMLMGSSRGLVRDITTYSTQYFDPKGEKEALADIQTGDMISVAGMLTQSGTESTIEAKFVRE